MSHTYSVLCALRMHVFFIFLFLVDTPTFVKAQSEVTVRVSSNSPTYAIYGFLTFYVTVKNNGQNVASDVVCIAPEPTGSSNVCNKTDVGFWRNWDTGARMIGNLNPGDSVTLQTTVFTLSSSGITMSANVTSSSSDSISNNNTSSWSVILGASAAHLKCDGSGVSSGNGGGNNGGNNGGSGANSSTDIVHLSVSLSGSNPELNYGLFESFVLTIKNSSNKTATNVKVQLALPAGLALQVSNVAGLGSFDLTTGIWTIDKLDAYNSHTITANAQIVQGGVFKCYAQVTACDQTDSNSKPNNYTGKAVEDDEADLDILGLWADLSMKAAFKAGTPAQIKVGDNVTFVATLTNSGPTRADGVKIRSYIPNGMQFISAITSIGIYDSHLGVWILSDDPDPNNYGNKPGFTIQANTSHTLEVTYKAVQTGIITYDIEVRSDNVPDPNSTPSNFNLAENDEAQVIFNVVSQIDTNPLADLKLTNAILLSPLANNDSIAFQIILTNYGPYAANVVVKNTASSALGISNYIPSGSSTYSNNLWTVNNLAAGSTAILTLSGRTNNINKIESDFAQVWTSNQPDPNSTPGNNITGSSKEDDETIISFGGAVSSGSGGALTLSISSNPPTYKIYATNTFRITVKNNTATTNQNLKIYFPYPVNTITGGTAVASLGTWNEWCSDGKQCYLWNISSLVGNGTATLDVPLFIQNTTDSLIATVTINTVSPIISASLTLAPFSFNSEPTAFKTQGDDNTQRAKNESLLKINTEIDNSDSILFKDKLANKYASLQNGLYIFPNPAKDALHVALTDDAIHRITAILFYNSLGSVIKKIICVDVSENIFNINVNDLSAGTYFVRAISDGRADFIQRFIIAR